MLVPYRTFSAIQDVLGKVVAMTTKFLRQTIVGGNPENPMILKSGDTVWHCSSESTVYIQNSITPLDCQRIKEYDTLSEDCEASRVETARRPVRPAGIACHQAVARVHLSAFSVSARYAEQTTRDTLRSQVVLRRMWISVNVSDKTLKPFHFESDREDWPDTECQDNESSEVNTVGSARDRSWCLCKNCVTMATDEESLARYEIHGRDLTIAVGCVTAGSRPGERSDITASRLQQQLAETKRRKYNSMPP
ncbi:hypothetical protein PR048_025495 [Dryococelus australis]|uniref:Uncharacterized protein n=1 Tax=Dryococelus australis TaxID=614101 RepID=A0ABQ9GRL0_9NEOP|nr:hypothetical protein PR048_025495 [Dryococelus australis]